MPLQLILDMLGVSHIHVAMLDVEGAEVNVLQTVDFHRLRIEVLIVETRSKAGNRTQPVIDAVLGPKTNPNPYRFWGMRGRDAWFLHNDFKPNVDPAIGQSESPWACS